MHCSERLQHENKSAIKRWRISSALVKQTAQATMSVNTKHSPCWSCRTDSRSTLCYSAHARGIQQQRNRSSLAIKQQWNRGSLAAVAHHSSCTLYTLLCMWMHKPWCTQSTLNHRLIVHSKTVTQLVVWLLVLTCTICKHHPPLLLCLHNYHAMHLGEVGIFCSTLQYMYMHASTVSAYLMYAQVPVAGVTL
jgi:hypothetical protein